VTTKNDLSPEASLDAEKPSDRVIRLEGLTKRFGSNVALERVSFEVPPGVVFALLGENGAGKTTAIRIMLGLLDADEGTATVLGLDSSKDGLEIRKRIGYVPEQPTLYEWMTVAEIGWFTAGFYGEGFLERYQKHAEQFGLPASRKLKALSKGMRAKVVLSLALANDPELLILDEPTSGLDVLVRREFLESMVDRAATGKTVFLSSHQINEVERVADVVGILREGHLVTVERLDRMKAEIHEVTLTLAGGAPPGEKRDILLYYKKAECPLFPRLFAYFPRGLPKRLWSSPAQNSGYGLVPFEPHTPLLVVCDEAYQKTGGREVHDAKLTVLQEDEPYSPEDLTNVSAHDHHG